MSGNSDVSATLTDFTGFTLPLVGALSICLCMVYSKSNEERGSKMNDKNGWKTRLANIAKMVKGLFRAAGSSSILTSWAVLTSYLGSRCLA
jgi:hypothetical protein